MNVVAYGGGVNSTAMLIGMYYKDIPVDLILFADPGAEQPYTYAYLPIINDWLINHGMPLIQTVTYMDKNGDRLTLEQECLRSGTLPAIAIEDKAKPNLITVRSLGRDWVWRDFVEADLNQTAMCWMFPEDDLPCNCHDGG